MKIILVALLVASAYGFPYAEYYDDNSIEGDDDVIDLSHLGARLFGLPDNKTGEIVASYNPETEGANPEELGNYLEGDMLMPKVQGRNGLTATSARWPNAVVPFEIKGSFGRMIPRVFERRDSTGFFRRCFPNESPRAGIQ